MAGWFAALGQGAAGQAVSGGIAMGMQRLGSRYDRRMNKKLQMQQMGIQMAGEREMMNYQQDKELEMLDKSPEATKQGLIKAGLNPALMYGEGGAGGSTIGHGGGGANVSTAPYVETSGKGHGMDMGSIAQIALLDAQRRNIEADTKLKETNVPKVEAETSNVKAQEALTWVQREIEQVKATVQRNTVNEQVEAMQNVVQEGIQKIQTAQLQNKITESTLQDQISKIKAEAIGALLQNANTQAKTNLTETEANAIATKLTQGWVQLSIEDRKVRVEEFKSELQAKYPGLWNVIGGQLNNVTAGILELTTGEKQKHSPKDPK